jgi:hypothetical protein
MAQSRVHHDFAPDLEINLKAIVANMPIFPGAHATVWMYQATLLKGEPASLETLPDSYVGPIIRARQG